MAHRVAAFVLPLSLALLAGACASKGPGVYDQPTVPVPDGGGTGGSGVTVPLPPWETVNRQSPAWYSTEAALIIADNIIYYQNTDGGWPKNVDMTMRSAARTGSTIDNSATTTQLLYLAKVFGATTTAKYQTAFTKGLNYLFAAQYDNGGWPQVYPNGTGYHLHITYNDGAMTHVLATLRDIGKRVPPYGFVDEAAAAQALAAVDKGIECILACQIVIEGVKTGWCAQHDEVTLAPAKAREYELPSESGQEGDAVLAFLMTIDQPSPQVVDAVQSAIKWFNKVQIHGIRVQRITDATQASGEDVVVVADPNAPPLWARFYELGTDVPFFCGRDGVKKYSLAEIENERRTGYSWYTDNPSDQLGAYPAWQVKWAPDNNVLAPTTSTP